MIGHDIFCSVLLDVSVMVANSTVWKQPLRVSPQVSLRQLLDLVTLLPFYQQTILLLLVSIM